VTDYGWEYVWHCHLLGHEENDMMRPLVFQAGAASTYLIPQAPPNVAATLGGNGQATVTFGVAPVAAGGTAVTGYTVKSSPGGTVDTNAGTISNRSHTITGLVNDGSHYTFTVRAANAAGLGLPSNPSNTITTSDQVAPVVTGFTIPAAFGSLTVPITSFTATDVGGVTGYMVTESATAPASGAAGWTANPPANHTFAAQGAHTLYAWAKDGAGNVSTSLSAPVTITLFSATSISPTLGVFRGGSWFWDTNRNGTWDGCGVDGCYAFGASTDIPVLGDWNGSGAKKFGVFRNGQWFLDLNGNGAWDGCGTDACYAAFGMAGDIPVVGAWTAGAAKIGVFRNGQWFLDLNGNGAWDGCGTDTCIASFGEAGDVPVVGDWNGTGTAKIGVFRNGQWFLDLNGNGVWDGCGTDACYTSFGTAGDIPVVGDWSGTGTTKIGVFRNGQLYLDFNGNGTWDGCGVDTCIGPFGTGGDKPFAK